MRLVDFWITQLWAESNKEGEEVQDRHAKYLQGTPWNPETSGTVLPLSVEGVLGHPRGFVGTPSRGWFQRFVETPTALGRMNMPKR